MEKKYIILIVHTTGGWEDVKFNFDDDDEPINVFCGYAQFNGNNPNDSLYEYFIIHTFKGKILLFQYSTNLDITNPILQIDDKVYDHVFCWNNFIFASSEQELQIFSFDCEKEALSLLETHDLPSPVLNMKSTSTDDFTLLIHLKDYTLKMIKKQNLNAIIHFESNILLYDVCYDTIVFIKNDLSKSIIRLNEQQQDEIINLSGIPYNTFLHNRENYDYFNSIDEINPGEININGNTLLFSKLISNRDNLIFCNDECNQLSFLNEEPFFETNDQIILFDQFSNSKDLITISRRPNLGLYPQFIRQNIETELDCQLDSINVETGEFDPTSPLNNFYDSNIFLGKILNILLDEENSQFAERAEKIVQILNFIINLQSYFIDNFLLSRILTYKFFKLSLLFLKPKGNYPISPISYSSLAILIDKAIKVASCKLSAKMLYMLRTDKSQNHLMFLIVPPVLSQFSDVHELAMSIIENIPEQYAKCTLSALLSCLKYTKCDIIRFADQCFNMQMIVDLNEDVLFLFKKLLILGNTIRNERLPDLVKLLLYSYKFISSKDPNNELMNKIRDFFEYKPQDLDIFTLARIQEEFNKYILELKTKFQEFLNQVRFYPQKDIAPEIQKFIKSHIPITICDVESKFRDDIEKLSKSGRLLRIKIEYINMIQDADDYVTLCQSLHFARKRGDA